MWNPKTACGQWLQSLCEALYAGSKAQLAPKIASYAPKNLEVKPLNQEDSNQATLDFTSSLSKEQSNALTDALSEFNAAARYFQQPNSAHIQEKSAYLQDKSSILQDKVDAIQDISSSFKDKPALLQDTLALHHSMGYSRILGTLLWKPNGYLVSGEFVDYAQRGFKAKLSYQEACNLIEEGLNTHCVGIQPLQEECLMYLENLNRLHVAADKLYKLAQPQFIYQGQTLQKLMQEFKNHYAFETVFLIPMPPDIY